MDQQQTGEAVVKIVTAAAPGVAGTTFSLTTASTIMAIVASFVTTVFVTVQLYYFLKDKREARLKKELKDVD